MGAKNAQHTLAGSYVARMGWGSGTRGGYAGWWGRGSLPSIRTVGEVSVLPSY